MDSRECPCRNLTRVEHFIALLRSHPLSTSLLTRRRVMGPTPGYTACLAVQCIDAGHVAVAQIWSVARRVILGT
ncbi:hypothetical protein MUK42_36391 [Musa troglodytarum]|uniref:Uncharacterized protein n=1 Tax=Musa troglodytarum TaxID=320322 RepID=A0A9E7FPG2_9LILI|nr:hypothetical protein MUK42_36391 [Musa troglodytarum]